MLLLLSLACTPAGDDSVAPIQTDDSTPPQQQETVVDEDGDGYSPGADCDDADVAVHPDATELCNDDDDDCDGQIDEAAIDFTTYYRDGDGDGFGLAGHTHQACAAPSGYVDNDDDCDDDDAAVNAFSVWYVDLDGDGYGTDEAVGTGCLEAPELVLLHGDCDDARPDTYATAPELCDAYDNDCDGAVDDDPADPPVWYYDIDGDNWGDGTKPIYACDAPAAAVPGRFDCDDADAAIHPDANETCTDGLDVDCSGRPSNGCVTEIDSIAVAGAWAWTGTSYFGLQLANAGDVDGDGFDDVVAGTYQYAGTEGIEYILSGNASPDTYADVEDAALAWIVGDDTYDYLGYDPQRAGDINGDGFDDVLIGSSSLDYFSCSRCGVSSVFFGPLSGRYVQEDADAWVPGASANRSIGNTGTSGDFDGDGQDDLIVGNYGAALSGTSYTYNGTLYFVRGPISGEIDPSHADGTFTGEASSYSASGVSSFRDADGDGVSDFAVGAYRQGTDDAGAVLVYYGPITGALTPETADFTFTGRVRDDRLGYTVEWAGDMNGDGSLDLAMGACYADEGGSNSGTVYVVSGPFDESTSTADAQAWLYANAASQLFGRALAEGADLDGDGFDDLLVGDAYDGTADTQAGGAYLFYGPLSGPRAARSADYAVTGSDYRAYAGIDVDTLDFDGDDEPDLLVGAYGANSSKGTAYVIPNTSF